MAESDEVKVQPLSKPFFFFSKAFV